MQRAANIKQITAINMSIKINGWGKWGKSVLDGFQRPDSLANLHAITTESLDLPAIPDPVISDIIFSNLPERQYNNILDPAVDCHVHVIHAADHFASGAICGAMRNNAKLPTTTQIGVVLIPSTGSNSATVGRLLTNILGLKNFFDICILIDLNSPALINRSDAQIVPYVAELGNLLQIFERSACMLPILKQMQARFLAFASLPLAKILEARSLEALAQKISVCPPKDLFSPMQVQSVTAFSVSKQGAQPEILKIIQNTLPRANTIYIPFQRSYEWQEASDPAEIENFPAKRVINTTKSINTGLLGAFTNTALAELFTSFMPDIKPNTNDFLGLFTGNPVSLTFWKFLKHYAKKYWPENMTDSKYETLDPEVMDWLKNNGFTDSTKLQHKYLLRSARDFIKNSIQQKGNQA